jgi:hypothetical protein
MAIVRLRGRDRASTSFYGAARRLPLRLTRHKLGKLHELF